MSGENNSQPYQDSDARKELFALIKDNDHFTNNHYIRAFTFKASKPYFQS